MQAANPKRAKTEVMKEIGASTMRENSPSRSPSPPLGKSPASGTGNSPESFPGPEKPVARNSKAYKPKRGKATKDLNVSIMPMSGMLSTAVILIIGSLYPDREGCL